MNMTYATTTFQIAVVNQQQHHEKTIEIWYVMPISSVGQEDKRQEASGWMWWWECSFLFFGSQLWHHHLPIASQVTFETVTSTYTIHIRYRYSYVKGYLSKIIVDRRQKNWDHDAFFMLTERRWSRLPIIQIFLCTLAWPYRQQQPQPWKRRRRKS